MTPSTLSVHDRRCLVKPVTFKVGDKVMWSKEPSLVWETVLKDACRFEVWCLKGPSGQLVFADTCDLRPAPKPRRKVWVSVWYRRSQSGKEYVTMSPPGGGYPEGVLAGPVAVPFEFEVEEK